MIIRLIVLVLSLTACSKEPAASFTLGCFRENESTLQLKIKNEQTTDLHVVLKKIDQVDGYLSSSYDPVNKIVVITYNNALARKMNYVQLFESAGYLIDYQES
jgi:hypothetical protein